MKNSTTKLGTCPMRSLLLACFAMCLMASTSVQVCAQENAPPDSKDSASNPSIPPAPEPNSGLAGQAANKSKPATEDRKTDKVLSEANEKGEKSEATAAPAADKTDAGTGTSSNYDTSIQSPAKNVDENSPAANVDTTEQAKKAKPGGAPLTIGNKEVFRVRVKLGPYTPELRIEAIKERLKKLEETPGFNPAAIKTNESPFSTDIVSGDTTILTVTDLDAEAAGSTRQVLAAEYAALLRNALQEELDNQSVPKLLWRIGMCILLTLAVFLGGFLSNLFFPWLYKAFIGLRGKVIKSVKFQDAVLLNEETIIDFGMGVLRVIRLLTVISLLTIYLTTALGLFPQTKALSSNIVQSLSHPFINIIFPAVLSYLPNLLFIAAILVCSYYLIGFVRFIFTEVERCTITIPGFDPEWATPTYKIVRFLLIAFTLVLIFPYLPGSGSPAFQQVSLFLGILLSLASSGAVAHLVAGVFLTYTGAFKVGDRVKIADTIGDVVEKTLLATRVRTIKQEIITIPNGLVLSSHIINYSSSAASTGLILHSTVTIGYDVPWKQVHELLIDAAISTGDILPEPRPFVFQTSLDDYYVSYQINAHTRHPQKMANIYSRLHQNIQDKFNQAGVEILSPRYSAMRDGNKVTIPDDYLPSDYKTPQFNVSLNQLESK